MDGGLSLSEVRINGGLWIKNALIGESRGLALLGVIISSAGCY